ncbi:MAG: hypothetical protein KatS3mg102_2064 [Planctomycetota bacterium]|nr:MAG: hypothetical protein KatS3mg102_2064 [Planctomycetota bacterium]
MQVIFKHVTGSKAGQQEVADAERITIGRNPTNTIVFDPIVDSVVSGDHAQLMLGDDGRLWLTDLRSTNGTFVNGQKVGDKVPVNPGDIVQFGKDGPEVAIEYTPGPKRGGQTRMMLAQVQSELEQQKAQAAASRKKAAIVIAAIVVVVLVGGIVAALTIRSGQARRDANKAVDAALLERGRAENRNALAYAAREWSEAEKLLTQAQAQLERGEYADAQRLADLAAQAYREAIDKVAEGRIAHALQKEREKAEAELRKLRAEQERRDREAAEQIRRMEEELRSAAGAEAERLRRQIEEMKRLQEAPKRVFAQTRPHLCYVRATNYIQPDGTQVRVPITTSEGSGFFFKDGLVVTVKHVLHGYKYDPEARAKSIKFLEEKKFETRTAVEVHVFRDGRFVKAFSTDDANLSVHAITPDQWEDQEIRATITWNEVETEVPVKLHVPYKGDLAILKVKESRNGLAAVAAPKADARVLGVGVSRAAGGDSIEAGSLQGDVKSVGTTVRVSGALPGTFAGGPLLDLDGKLVGVLLGTEPGGATTVALPASAIESLLGGGGSVR